MKHIKYIAYISLFLLASCSTTKNLPEGEVLYTGIKKIEVTNEDKSKEGEEALTEIEAALAYPPNNALLGSSSIRIPLPFGLWVYNAFVNRRGKFNKWIFNKLASKPVFINTVNRKSGQKWPITCSANTATSTELLHTKWNRTPRTLKRQRSATGWR